MEINQVKNNIITTTTGKKYEKPNALQNVVGIFVANTASRIVASSVSKIPPKHLLQITDSITQQEKEYFTSVADKLFKKSGLAEKGVKIINAIEQNRKEINDIWKQTFKIDITKFPQLNKFFEQIFAGRNAVFNKHTKTILINKEKLGIALPHEIGHALNSTGKGIGKILSTTRSGTAILSLLITTIVLCKRKKVEGEQPNGFFDKITTFIKNHCGKLAVFCAVPHVTEEALASKKGVDLIKTLNIPESHLHKLKTLNKVALTTHIATAVAGVLGIVTLSKVKDFITKPKEILQ